MCSSGEEIYGDERMSMTDEHTRGEMTMKEKNREKCKERGII
jgi:hypothetical protein